MLTSKNKHNFLNLPTWPTKITVFGSESLYDIFGKQITYICDQADNRSSMF